MKNRRTFIKESTIAAAGLTTGIQALGRPGRSIIGANEKIRVGFIGVGNRGSQLMDVFMKQPNCEIAALCDIYEPYLKRDRSMVHPRYIKDMGGQIPRMGEKFPFQPKLYDDYRKLLEDKTIDAVCIATPDHWHAIQTIEAIKAGKDVFVEKPLTQTIKEGRAMVNAEKASDRVVAVGLNRRGNESYQKLVKEIASGKIGKVTLARAARINNMFPNGIGKLQPETPPADFNWDQWLGPREFRPYQYNIAPYMFRWWSQYSSQMGNWGVHFMDVIRWILGEKAPSSITAHGGKYVLDHDGDIPDSMEVTFEFASGTIVTFSIFEATGGSIFPYGEVELRGTKGSVYASQDGYRIAPVNRGQFQNWNPFIEKEEYKIPAEDLPDGSNAGSTTILIKNFLECVKTRNEPICPLEEGHRSTSFAHLANIALATKSRLEWDQEKELFTNNDEANKLLHYEYRKPYKL